jgi:hypothetical protein
MKNRPPDVQTWMRAVDEGDAARVESLLAAGADVNATSEGNETALMRAASKGYLEVVQVLLDAGGDVHAKSENGFTPLFMAVFFGHADVVRALLAKGSNPAFEPRLNMTPEKWARLWVSADIVELLKNADAVRTQGEGAKVETASGERPDAHPLLFPADGQFRHVVPLSEIGETAAVESAPQVEAVSAEVGPRKSDPVQVRQSDERDDEQDETTLVPTRVRPTHAPTPHPTHAVRTKAVWQSWPVMAAAIVLSVMAGLAAGTYLVRLGPSAETRRPAPPAVDAAQAAEVGPQVIESQSATATSDAQHSQPAPQPSEQSLPVETGAASAAVAPVVNTAGESDAKTRKVKGDESASKPAPPTSASRRAPDAEQPPARRVVIAEARLERPASVAERRTNSSPATKPARQDSLATHRARVTNEHSSTSAAPGHSLPVSSPPPSAKSKKVIQWP